MRQALPLAFLLLVAACSDGEAPFFVETRIAGDTLDPVADYGVITVVRDNRSVAWVRLRYRLSLDAAELSLELEPGESQDVWRATLPGPGFETRIYYYLEAADGDDNRARDPARAPDSYSFDVGSLARPPLHLDASVPDRRAGDGPGVEDTGAEDAGSLDRGLADGGPEDGSIEDGPVEDAGIGLDRRPADVALEDSGD